MKIDDLTPSPKEKIHFILSSVKSVPKDCGCYILATFDNDILYVGLSDNLNVRFKQHLANPEKTKPTKEGKAIWFYYMIYDRNNLSQLERTWLNHFSRVCKLNCVKE